MSNLNAVRAELRLGEERGNTAVPRLGVIAAVALLVLATSLCVAEIRLLPTVSPDQVSDLLFGAG